MRVTLNDIAKRANVNPSTVSRILSNQTKFPVSQAKREQVLRIARELNYEPKRAAQSLVSGRSYVVAAVLGALERDLASPTFSIILGRMARELWASGYALTLLPTSVGAPDDEVLRTLRGSHADAYFVPYSLLQPKTLEELKRVGTPVVSLHGPVPHNDHGVVSYVRLDEQPANDAVVQALVRLGHRRVLCMASKHLMYHTRRFEPFHKAAAQFGQGQLSVEQLVYSPLESDALHDRAEARRVVRANWDRIRRFSAVMCGSDTVAMGLIDELRDHGLEPGVDISVVGHDNLEQSPHFRQTEPMLATIDRRNSDIGQLIADLLLKHIEQSDHQVQTHYLPLRFIARESLGPAPGS